MGSDLNLPMDKIFVYTGLSGKGKSSRILESFADPITNPCETYGRTQFLAEALSYRHRGNNIMELMKLTIDEAAEYFQLPRILKHVRILPWTPCEDDAKLLEVFSASLAGETR